MPIVNVTDRAAATQVSRLSGTRRAVQPAFSAAKSTPVQTRAPRFGGVGAKLLAGSSDGLISLFQKITEIYLVGFLAIDVVALWITRIVKGLTRGAEPYDAASDPANEGRPPSEVLRRSFLKKMQGLNWLNAAEEALREIITGPAGFIVPAVTFSFATRQFGKNSVELGYGPLTQLKNGFAAHLGDTPGDITPAQLREKYREFLEKVLTADKEMIPEHKLKLTPQRKIDLPDSPYHRQTFERYIKDWTKRWVETAGPSFEKDLSKQEGKAIRESLEKLNAEFEEIVGRHYNTRFRLADRLNHRTNITTALEKVGKEEAEQSIDKLLANLTRFKDFAREVAKAEKPAGAKLAEIADKTYRKLVGKKFAFALLATFAASAFLYIVPRISQRNKHYPANRLMMEGGGQPNSTQPAAAGAPSQPVQMANGTPDINQLLAALGGGPQ